MKKITLEFTGDDLENGLLAAKATDLFLAINEFDQHLRSLYKYQDIEKADVYDLREKLHECLGGFDCSLDMLS